MGHAAYPVGVRDNLGLIRQALHDYRPHVAFNLLEEFHGIAVFDQHVVSYLELLKQAYTGCNPRGLLLAHDKALTKKILTYHRIPTPWFTVAERGRSVRPIRRSAYPLLVKSAIEEASLGIAQASVVHNEERMRERVAYIHEELKTDALVEQYIEGRELYVGVLGNRRLQTLPVWEMLFKNVPEGVAKIATARAKWDYKYQKKMGIETRAARKLPSGAEEQIIRLCKRVYRVLCMSGYGRMDLRMTDEGRVFVLEANPNPNLSYGEDFAESAAVASITFEQLLQRILNLGLSYRPHGYE
jgi:D-alanine-D-alanine ligase